MESGGGSNGLHEDFHRLFQVAVSFSFLWRLFLLLWLDFWTSQMIKSGGIKALAIVFFSLLLRFTEEHWHSCTYIAVCLKS